MRRPPSLRGSTRAKVLRLFERVHFLLGLPPPPCHTEHVQKMSSKRESTRRHLVDVALSLFSNQGFEKTTMRDIAKGAKLSLGASYYHFKSKDQLVLAFYERAALESTPDLARFCESTKDFKKRFTYLLEQKFGQFSEHRALAKVLARHGADFSHPLSPFSDETKVPRHQAINLIQDVIEGCNLKVSKKLRPHLPMLLWFFQMSIILYWANDSSPNQEKTKQLIALSLALMVKSAKLSLLPGYGSFHKHFEKIVAATLSSPSTFLPEGE